MGYLWTNTGKQIHVKLVHKSASVLHLSVENIEANILGYMYSSVIKSENLVLVKDFALQCSTTFANGTVRNALIPMEYILDVVINEVFHNMKVIYVLQVLTKGNLYRRKPVITLLHQLKPGLTSLKIIYEELHSTLDLEEG